MGGIRESNREFYQHYSSMQSNSFRAHFLSFSKSNIFYGIDLKFISLLKPNMLLMYMKFYNNINKTLEVIIILLMIVFLGHPIQI